MKLENKMGIIAIIYSIILVSIVWIVAGKTLMIYALLGAAVSLFNHAQTISFKKVSKKEQVMTGVVIRWVMIITILVYVAYDTNRDTTSLLMTLLGLLASKVGILLGTVIFKNDLMILQEYNNEEKESDENEGLHWAGFL